LGVSKIAATKYLNNTPTMSNALSMQDVHKTNKKAQTHALNIQVSVNQLHQYKHKEIKHHFLLQRSTKCNNYVDNPALDDVTSTSDNLLNLSIILHQNS